MSFQVNLPVTLVPRGENSRTMVYLAPLLAVFLTLIAGGIMFAVLGQDPGTALYTFFISPLSTVYGLAELTIKATPLILCATGLALGFRANVWNIGAEGQFTMGVVFSGGLAVLFYDVDSIFILPAMILLGILGGAAWAAIPAFLKTRFNANEILTSLMMTYVAILLLDFLVRGPWRDPDGFNFPESRLFGDSALLPLLVEGTRANFGALIALAGVAGAWVLMSRLLIGFQIKVIGVAPIAGRYAGFSQKATIWLTLLLGGGFAGLAGMVEISGPVGQLVPSIPQGYGFTAIIVAFLGRLHPVGILFAGLLMALTYLGGEAAQMRLGLPVAVTGVFQGMLLFFLLACDVLVAYRIKVKG